MNQLKYYVYGYAYPKDHQTLSGIFYSIGKGSGKRAYTLHGDTQRPFNKDDIIIFSSEMSETNAFLLEKELILKYGREDLGEGFLKNKTSGGGGNSGYIITEETRLKQSLAQLGEKSHLFGKKRANEIGIKIANKQRGNKNHQYNKPKLQETIDKISMSLTGRKQSLSTCPHCLKKGGASTMKRWHFNKCKFYINNASNDQTQFVQADQIEYILQ